MSDPNVEAQTLLRALGGGEVDSRPLREFAGPSARDVRESRDLFLAAMAGLGVEEARDVSCKEPARFWAREMIAGSVSPYEGSRPIWCG